MPTRRPNRAHVVAALGILVAISACTPTPPPLRLSSPWLRADLDRGGVPAGSLVSVKVAGTRATLPGQPDFANAEMAEKVKSALERRGYRIGAADATVEMSLSYRTERHDYSASYSSVRTSNTNSTFYQSRSTQHASPAVAIASLVSAFASLSNQSTAVSNWSEARKFYAHDVSICARDRQGALLWQSESTWDSDSVDISDEIDAFIAKSMTSLPRVEGHLVRVPMLADQRATDYYRTYCSGNWFSSPALPYRITFAGASKRVELNTINLWSDSRIVTTTRSSAWRALPLYLDLVTHAEDALPIGAKADEVSVTSAAAWSIVLIGNRYTTGRDAAPVNVLMRLVAQPDGYVITDCHTVSDSQYAKYTEMLAEWQDRVRSYWNFYEN